MLLKKNSGGCKRRCREASIETPPTNFEQAVPWADARSCPRCWSLGSLPRLSMCGRLSHTDGHPRTERPHLKKKGTSVFHLIIVDCLHTITEEVPRRTARLSLCFAHDRICRFPLFFLNPGSILNTRTCSAATRRAIATWVNMCVRQDCQLRTLFTALVLAAAVADIYGQGKNLGLARTLWGLFRLLPFVELHEAKVGKDTTIRSTSVCVAALAQRTLWFWIHNVLIEFLKQSS